MPFHSPAVLAVYIKTSTVKPLAIKTLTIVTLIIVSLMLSAKPPSRPHRTLLIAADIQPHFCKMVLARRGQTSYQDCNG